jgi:hypothetical protein
MSLSTIVLEVGGVFEQSANQDSSGNIGVNLENIQEDSTGAQFVNTEGLKATYSCFQLITTALYGGIISVLPGSATKTIRVLRVEVSIQTSGTPEILQVAVAKTLVPWAGGTSTAMAIMSHDSNNPAASAAPIGYSVSPTSGGSGAVEVGAVYCSDSSNALTLGANTQAWDWGTRPGQSIVLRGTGEQLAVYLAGSVATQTMLVTYEWTEE